MDLDVFYMNEAIKLAKRAGSEDEVPIGALIVAGDKIIAKLFRIPVDTCEIISYKHLTVAGDRHCFDGE
jgi:tRNA(Arg) A34 adenosine deaminase TadA